MITVVCLNWKNYLGRGDDYVNRLRNMVQRHLTIPYEFVVVTENDLYTWEREGWWNKLSLLDMFPGEVFYLDLDLIITSNIDHLVEIARSDPSKIWMRDDFSYSIVNPKIDPSDRSTVELLGGVGCCNSSVMLWTGYKNLDSDELMAAAVKVMHGDQNVISALFWPHGGIGLLPNESIKSYKYHWRMDGTYGPITVFHGDPKNHEVSDDWVVQHWR